MDCPNLGDDSLANTAERRRMFGLATRIPYLCSMPLEHPGVHVPPPLVYAAGFLAGWLVDRLHPLRITTTLGNGRVIIAGVCFVVWLALMLAAFTTFGRAKTTPFPNRPASALVTSGPYRFTRNPMYLSLIALYVGLTLMLNSWWPLMMLPLVLVIIDRAVIAREERYLTDAFPADYPAYQRRVRRWL